MKLTSDEELQMLKLTKAVQDFMINKANPHTRIVIDLDGVTVEETKMFFPSAEQKK